MDSFSNFEFFLDPILIVNKQMEILYSNGAAEGLFQVTSKRIKGKILLNLFKFDEKTMLDISNFSPIQNRLVNWSYKETTNGKAFVSFFNYSVDPNIFIFYLKDQTVEDGLYAQTKIYIKELQQYSKELESRVQERTKEIYDLSKNQTALLNSVNQGFLIFKEDGKSVIHSKACENMFDISLSSVHVNSLLKMNENTFESWIQALYEEVLPFEDIKDLGPSSIVLNGKTINLNFFPIRNENETLNSVVMVATDISDKVRLEYIFDQESQKSKRIISIIKRKDQLDTLISECKKLTEKLFVNPNDWFSLHTLKGVSGSFYLKSVVDYIHELENKLKHGFKVSFDEVKSISYMLEEFYQEVESLIGISSDIKIDKESINQILKVVTNKEESDLIKKIITQKSLKKFLSGYNDVMIQMANSLNKKVYPIDFTNDVKIDFSKYQDVMNQMVHMFRNIMDHGIEAPSIRSKNGKDEYGKVKVSMSESEQGYNIEVSDDGAGIDLNKIKSKFDCTGLTDAQCMLKIFDTHVSLKEEVSEISGRGVGLSSVKDAVEKIGGTIAVSSELNQGTSFKFYLPK